MMIIGLLFIVISTSGCFSTSINNTGSPGQVEKFSSYGVSFYYPANWQVSVSNYDDSKTIVVSKDYFTQLEILITPNFGISEEGMLHEKNNTITPGWNKISNDTIIIDNQTAYRSIFIGNEIYFLFKEMRHEDITFLRNNNTYSLLITVPTKEYAEDKQNFETILNSIHVQRVEGFE